MRITDAEGNQWKVDPKVNSHMTQSWTHAFGLNLADCCVFAYLQFILNLLKPRLDWRQSCGCIRCVLQVLLSQENGRNVAFHLHVCVPWLIWWSAEDPPPRPSALKHTHHAPPFMSRCQLCARLHWRWSVPSVRKVLPSRHTALANSRCAVPSVFEEVHWSQMLNLRSENKWDLQPRIVLTTLRKAFVLFFTIVFL